MTNRRITAMEQLQSQQIQVQNMLLEQMKQSNQLVRQEWLQVATCNLQLFLLIIIYTSKYE
jgi:hypothetical protein